jgi:hypothetical protein
MVHDSDVMDLSLLRRGECLDELRSELFEQEPSSAIAPKWEHWSPMLDAPVEHIHAELAEQEFAGMALNRFAKHLNFGLAALIDAEDVSEERFTGLARIRLTPAKAAKQRRIVRPSIPKEAVPVESNMIPELFIGKAVDVKRQWSKVLKKLFDTRSWDEALAAVPHVEIDELGLYLHTTPPIPFDDDPLPRIQLYAAAERFTELAYDRFKGPGEKRVPIELMLEGMARPWFCLACVATQFAITLRERRDIVIALKRILRCWPHLIRWSERLEDITRGAAWERKRDPWWSIYIHVLRMCADLGHNWEREVEPWRKREPDEVAMQIAKWVSEAEKAVQ